MPSQSRIILILHYLDANTNAERAVTTRDIKAMLAEHGLSVPDSRTVDADVEQLIAAGYDILRTHENGSSARYRVMTRDFDAVELKVLIDAVAASRFLSAEKSRSLIGRLAAMADPAARPYLEKEPEYAGSVKRAVGGALYAADALMGAMARQRKVQFRMIEYRVPDKAQVPHRGGKAYTVSPYAVLWVNDRYYLVAYEEKRDRIITPRLDHIRRVKVLDEEALPRPKGFDIGRYYSQVYKMYDGPEEDVTIECENELLGKFMDRFGTDFECVPTGDGAFRATVRTCVGNTFFGWLCQYGGRMAITAPEDAANRFAEHLRQTLSAQGVRE